MTITETVGWFWIIGTSALAHVAIVWAPYQYWKRVLDVARAAEVHAPPIKILRSER